jgi:hypothetical protein
MERGSTGKGGETMGAIEKKESASSFVAKQSRTVKNIAWYLTRVFEFYLLEENE